jgi:hypothetical protein
MARALKAMTLGGDEVQQRILEEIEGGSGFSAVEIKAALLDDRAKSIAIASPKAHPRSALATARAASLATA